jgi:murein DD-endopeptidase MepM/ murein hydrolase activator NlpD
MVDLYFPLVGPYHFKNDYDLPRGGYHHTGIDIGASPLTPIVAPFSGTIGFKRETFWIYGDNGWAALGTHLNDNNYGKHDHHGDRDVMFAPYLRPGQHVQGGEFIGYVGDSGNATGPHLHFELFAPGKEPIARRLRNPWPSLIRSQHLHEARITIPNADVRPSGDELRLDACVRTTFPNLNKAIFILVAKENTKGKVMAVADAGGWEALTRLPENRTVALFVKDRPDIEGATVDRLLIN